MRDVILLGAKEFAPDVYGGLVSIRVTGIGLVLQFAISETDYVALKNITASRPFGNIVVGTYAYRFTGLYSKAFGDESAKVRVVVQLFDRRKNYDFECSNELIARLLWFQRITSIEEVENLIISVKP
ncbi:MAG TPA: hypothetical protein VEY71_00060 [Chitinophagales bacterium]|nr:hypothetical protein [Chitinophagales bacterium]